jgi:hypothetical protein
LYILSPFLPLPLPHSQSPLFTRPLKLIPPSPPSTSITSGRHTPHTTLNTHTHTLTHILKHIYTLLPLTPSTAALSSIEDAQSTTTTNNDPCSVTTRHDCNKEDSWLQLVWDRVHLQWALARSHPFASLCSVPTSVYCTTRSFFISAIKHQQNNNLPTHAYARCSIRQYTIELMQLDLATTNINVRMTRGLCK